MNDILRGKSHVDYDLRPGNIDTTIAVIYVIDIHVI